MIRKVSLFAAFALTATVVVAQVDDDDWGDDEVDAAEAAVDEVADAIHDAVDAAEADVDIVLDEHHTVEVIEIVEPPEPVDPCEDREGSMWIGITSAVGFLWWLLWGWFIYMPTNSSDSTMNVVDGASN